MARYALCVGINEFKSLPRSSWLSGCVNDAEDIAKARSGRALLLDSLCAPRGVAGDRRSTQPQGVGEQQLRIQARRVRVGRADRDHRGVQRLAHRHPAERGAGRAHRSSARRFSSDCSAVVNSSSSPSSTSSRLCAVKFTRWSVTRRWL